MGKDASGQGSYMVGGRTFRKIITTNEQKPTGQGEPKALRVVTTAIIPEAPKVAAPIEGTDLSRMITTHDEPKKTSGDILREGDKEYFAEAARKIDSDFEKDATGADKGEIAGESAGAPDGKPVKAPTKKPGGGKKAK